MVERERERGGRKGKQMRERWDKRPIIYNCMTGLAAQLLFSMELSRCSKQAQSHQQATEQINVAKKPWRAYCKPCHRLSDLNVTLICHRAGCSPPHTTSLYGRSSWDEHVDSEIKDYVQYVSLAQLEPLLLQRRM